MNELVPPSNPKLSLRSKILSSITSLSLTGKIIFYILVIAFVGSAISLLWRLDNYFMVEVPARGGTLTEGVVGLPRYINPILAISDGDKDITALVYSGLMRQTASGTLIPDLAEKYATSTDGKTYTFTLKPRLVFHDGTPVTADDVVYTITQVQNPAIKSPKQAVWSGVTVQKVDDRTITFTLPQPSPTFLDLTTIGILPKHIWSKTTADTFPLDDHNANPVGTGPYKVGSVSKDASGIPTSYTLKANKRFALGMPYINTIVLKFYSTEKALESSYRSGATNDMNSVTPAVARELNNHGSVVYTSPLPRVFGVFFNQTANDALAQGEVRQALDMTTNRDYIVNTVLQGYGVALVGPTPESQEGNSPSAFGTSTLEERIQIANALLDKAGWKMNDAGIREKKTAKGTTTLAFSISTSDATELKDVAEIVKNEWRNIGADVTVKVFEGGYLNQNIIRPRKYDALLFGQIINTPADLYAFWHSSQRSDPGLNIALYKNSKIDTSLENLRTLTDPTMEASELAKVTTTINQDVPAVFLYSPDFIYVTSGQIHNLSLDALSTPSERFNNVYTWYINTDRVWKIFARP